MLLLGCVRDLSEREERMLGLGQASKNIWREEMLVVMQRRREASTSTWEVTGSGSGCRAGGAAGGAGEVPPSVEANQHWDDSR